MRSDSVWLLYKQTCPIQGCAIEAEIETDSKLRKVKLCHMLSSRQIEVS